MWMSAMPLWIGFWLTWGVVTQSTQPPVFRSGVELVTVDVTVVGPGGRPVENLTADQFRLRVDGVPRRIVRAVYVPHKPAPPPVAPAPVHFSSNEHVEAGRLLLIAVDQQHIRRVEGLAALRAAASFVDQLDPADRVAAAPLSYMGPLQFTDAHASVKSYLQTLAGTASAMPGQFTIGLSEALAVADGNRAWLDRVVLRECGEPLGRIENPARAAANEGVRDPCPVQIEQESRALAQEARTSARLSLNALMGLVSRLGELDGPKVLVLVSEGLVAEPQLIDLTSLGAAAQAARVTIYVLQLEQAIFDASESIVSPTLYQDLQLKADGLIRLAGAARGAHFRLVGADPHPFRRILQEISGYYLLAFEASTAEQDGRTRRVDVTTSVPGAVVRARSAFRDAARRRDADEAQIVRLLRSPRLATELPLRVTTHTFREGADGRVRVVVAAQAEVGPGAAATVGYVLVDGTGVIAASGTEATADGRLLQAVAVPPGRYTLKGAAIDATGRQGSVERVFEARLRRAGAVGISDLALSEARADEPVRPVIAHAAGAQLAAVFEVYAAPGATLAHPSALIDVKPAAAGHPLLTVRATVKPTGASSWRGRAEFSLRELPAGPYLVTARITLPDGSIQTIERGFLR